VLVLGVIGIGILVLGCGDDDEPGPAPVPATLADFEGTWEATKFELTSKANPLLKLDLVTLGGSFTMEADNAGNFTGLAEIPDLGTGPLTLPLQGTLAIVGTDSLTVSFNPEFPPLLTNFTAPFVLSGDDLQIIDQNTTFDFDNNGSEDPAIFVGEFSRI
jgi:hypothetical protein